MTRTTEWDSDRATHSDGNDMGEQEADLNNLEEIFRGTQDNLISVKNLRVKRATNPTGRLGYKGFS